VYKKCKGGCLNNKWGPIDSKLSYLDSKQHDPQQDTPQLLNTMHFMGLPLNGTFHRVTITHLVTLFVAEGRIGCIVLLLLCEEIMKNLGLRLAILNHVKILTRANR
jgi:hypothetical protein